MYYVSEREKIPFEAAYGLKPLHTLDTVLLLLDAHITNDVEAFT